MILKSLYIIIIILLKAPLTNNQITQSKVLHSISEKSMLYHFTLGINRVGQGQTTIFLLSFAVHEINYQD